MREKPIRDVSDDKQYNFGRPLDEPLKKRLDLNDLLQRAKTEKKNDKKHNLLIFSGAASAVVATYLLLSM